MEKSIEDYRNIIKILKLQLLKVREENSSLSHDLGIASESQTFTPRINHYKQSKHDFAKNILSFLLFAHRCQIIGVTPEMVFRIADKQRDKKIMKRLKLRMSDVEINQFVSLVKKDNDILYDDYLQALSAFQVNAEKYPPKGSRTYVQLCLLKFGQEAKDHRDADTLYKKMNRNEDKPYLSFENYTDFVRRNMNKMEQYEIVAVFVGLDLLSECQIQKQIFRREVGKVFSLLEKGVNFEQEISKLSIDSRVQTKGNKAKDNTLNVEARRDNRGREETGRPAQTKTKDQVDFDVDEQTGVEAAAKKKKQPAVKKEDPGKQISLAPGNFKKVIDELKKEGIRISQFMDKILGQESKKVAVRSFTVYDFFESCKALKSSFPKKKVMNMFKVLDNGQNGTIDTSELLKIWIRAKQMTDSDEILYRLLYRHLRQIQYPDPLMRLEVLGIDSKGTLTLQNFKDMFEGLQLEQDQSKKIMISFIGDKMPLEKFCEKLKSEGKPESTKKFSKMDAVVYNQFKAIAKKINDKRNKGKNCRWRKLMRLEDTGQKSTEQDYWEFIFTDEWACWEHCLDVASKLDTFWRDPQFGPSKSDPHGIRSIVGNESDPPPALPDQSQIMWMTFQELLARRNQNNRVTFLETKLNANQVVQGNIGDCWYVSSLSIIANKQQFIKGYPYEKCKKSQTLASEGVNPYLFKFFSQYGMYVFKFYKKFEPVYVVVDDLFPVQTELNELLFAKSPDTGMQWPAFLEKAYSKLHHSYSNMISGDIAQGLNDLTNALPIKQSLEKDKQEQNKQKIKRLTDEGELMGCSISAEKGAGVEEPVTLDDQRCGLFYGHAYSIIDFLDLNASDRKKFDLIRVRNPWGHGEWLLDWSDTPIDNNPQYEKFKQYQKDIDIYYDKKQKDNSRFGKAVPPTYQPNSKDGEFLMNFTDFNQLYTNLFTGFTVQSFNSKYEGRTISERWDEKMPSGICKLKGAAEKDQINFVKNNAQYILQVEQDNTDILMYVVQEDGRLYRGQKYPYKELCNPALILSFTLSGSEKQLAKFDQSKLTFRSLNFERRREVNLWNKFKKGKYAIIPCRMKSKIGDTDFEFRIYSEKGKKINIRRSKGGNDFRMLTELVTKQIDQGQYDQFLDLLHKTMKK